MPYADGSWGEKAKAKSKRRLKYFRQYAQNHYNSDRYKKDYIKKGYNMNSAYPKGIRCFGKEAANWQGGITPLRDAIRGLPEYRQWRDAIFQRDNYTCQSCDKRGGNLEAHHSDKFFAELLVDFLREYDQFSPYEDQDTLVRLATKWQPFWTAEGETLCRDCHNLTFNYKRKVVKKI